MADQGSEHRIVCGGMWRRKDRNGRDYFYFQVDIAGTRYEYHAFINNRKDKPTHPDYRVFQFGDGSGKPSPQRQRITENDCSVKEPQQPQEPQEEEKSNDQPVEANGIRPEEAEEDDRPW